MMCYIHHDLLFQTETVEEPVEEEEASEEEGEKKEAEDEDEEDEDDATVEEEEEKPKTKKVGVASLEMVGVAVCCCLCVTSVYTFMCVCAEISLESSEDVGVGMIWEELLTTAKHLYSTHLKIKGICSLKALKFERLKYTGENTVCGMYIPAAKRFTYKCSVTVLWCQRLQSNDSRIRGLAKEGKGGGPSSLLLKFSLM